jgi:Family of unknown function (DUF6328)
MKRRSRSRCFASWCLSLAFSLPLARAIASLNRVRRPRESIDSSPVLFLFAIALALDLVIAGTRVAGPWTGAAAGLTGGLVAIGFWYGPLMIKDKEPDASMTNPNEKTSTAAKIEYVLTEARVVLPGAQALLGFQLVIVLTTGFAELHPSTKALHGVALGFIALATILLMTPAAYTASFMAVPSLRISTG